MLLLLALLMTVAAALLMGRLNDRAVIRAEYDAATGRALQLAKSALIAYAATDANRPGELPCPDHDGDGVIKLFDDYSGSSCRSLVGWLPWNTLNLPELRDGSGARLWYAVSDTYHANGTVPINPDTPTVSDLAVDGGTRAVVAVVLAPGEAVGGQPRARAGEGNAASDVVAYLEGDNADGDTSFATVGGTGFNDRMVAVTRAELLAAVQKRVTGEVAATLQRYRAAHGRYPWLSPFSAPDSANASPSFTAVHGTVSGQLAFTDTATPEPDFDFDSALKVTWTWTAGDDEERLRERLRGRFRITSDDPGEADVIVSSRDADALQARSDHFFLDPVNAGLMSLNAGAQMLGGSVDVPYAVSGGGGATCTWTGRNDAVRCTWSVSAGYDVTVCRHRDVWPPVCALRPVIRTYAFDLNFAPSAVTFGSNANVRVRGAADTNGRMTITEGRKSVISITDTVVHDPSPPDFSDRGSVAMSWTLTIADGDRSTIDARNVYTEIQAPGAGGPEDLPAWFVENEWYRYLLVSYPAAMGPTGSGACTPTTECVSVAVNDVEGTVDDAWAVVVSSGVLLPGQSRAGSTPALAGFEEDNADGDGLTAERKRAGAAFNDHVTLVECASGPCR
jgi:hypothetical protein